MVPLSVQSVFRITDGKLKKRQQDITNLYVLNLGYESPKGLGIEWTEMNLSAFLTSAGINSAICVVLLLLYSILRKQPGNVNVYFGQRLARLRLGNHDPSLIDRFVPSASWILKAWKTSEEEILAIGGLDAVVFLRTLVFSIRIFSVAAIICTFLVLPLNYFGREMQHRHIPSESLEVFTIGNVKEGSTWLGVHCFALYVISCFACVLLYFEYKSIATMRVAHVTGSHSNPSNFTVLVRAIPRTSGESYSDLVTQFFSNYYASSYLSHQMVYRSRTVQRLVSNAEKMYKMLKFSSTQQQYGSSFMRCGLCGGTANSFKTVSRQPENAERSDFGDSDLREKECAAALVFFRTRYAAFVASQALQSPNPMLWVTELAPEPHDLCWKNLCIPYKLLWIRKIASLLAFIVFMFFFLAPVSLVTGLASLDKLQNTFPFMRRILKRKFMNQLVTGYLPSVILILFLYIVPPLMMLFSAVEGYMSRSGRKRSACLKVLYFYIWNVFFANILVGSVIARLSTLSSPKDVPSLLAKVLPQKAFFFMTYVLTSGWASLACEVVQPFSLLCNLFRRFIFRNKDVLSFSAMSFPFHTEIPRVLLFGLLGFTFSILAPLILPFLLVYFCLAYLVYRNQILNVYVTRYQSGGLYWPIVHSATIFSLLLTQIIALGVFGIKKSPVASSFTIPLIICTLFFNMYCRQRFLLIFKNNVVQILIEMDRQDEQGGKLEGIHEQLYSAYCQFPSTSPTLCTDVSLNEHENGADDKLQDLEGNKPGPDEASSSGSSPSKPEK
ncbi:hypothetical protein RJ639_038342 [Escallonia herrerae]|uniref:CSC1-like protein RXW8 n=1 Tax=Escallonia herrerae TaxID=1293975 RepID=A0AA88WNQ0_9ASTE|nr:hypothetical protein RJ639_038342 [Escallonia herrerae]